MTPEVDLAAPLRIADLRAARDPVAVVVGPAVRDRVAAGRDLPVQGARRRPRGVRQHHRLRRPRRLRGPGRPARPGRQHARPPRRRAGPGPRPRGRPGHDAGPGLVAGPGRVGRVPHVIDALVAMLATTFVPAMPRLGSVGASGDLIPLGAAAQALRGRGHAYVDGVRLPAAEALAAAGLEPLPLDGRDALALVNGTSLTTAARPWRWTPPAPRTGRCRCSPACSPTCSAATRSSSTPGCSRAYGHAGAIDVGGGHAPGQRRAGPVRQTPAAGAVQHPVLAAAARRGRGRPAVRRRRRRGRPRQRQRQPAVLPRRRPRRARRQLLRPAGRVRRRPAVDGRRAGRQPRRASARPARRPAPQRRPARRCWPPGPAGSTACRVCSWRRPR